MGWLLTALHAESQRKIDGQAWDNMATQVTHRISMNTGRRNFMVLGALTGMGGLSACSNKKNNFITSSLFENQRYVESVSSLLISSDDKNIVVITEKYHYVFDAPPEMVAALKAPFHPSIEGSLGTLVVKGSGAAFIRYELSLKDEASPQAREQALAAGFKARGKGVDTLSIQGALHGTRYASGGLQLPAQSPLRLNRTYQISVDAELSPAEKYGRALLTPVTLTADGAMVLGAVAVGIALLPVLIPVTVALLKGGAGSIGLGP